MATNQTAPTASGTREVKHTFTSSSLLREGTYDRAAASLTLTFNDGSRYRYSVEEPVATGLFTATSAGRFFAQNIKTVKGTLIPVATK